MIKRCFVFFTVILVTFFSVFAAYAQSEGETPKESDVILNLKLGLVVFLCFHDAAESSLDKIKADVGAVAANFRGAIEAVYVSGDDKKEDKLRLKFKIQPNETALFIILPSGRAVAKLNGKDITKTNLLRAVVSTCGGGGCGSGGGGCGSR